MIIVLIVLHEVLYKYMLKCEMYSLWICEYLIICMIILNVKTYDYEYKIVYMYVCSIVKICNYEYKNVYMCARSIVKMYD